MEELTLNCAIIDDSGRTMDAFDVKIRNGEKVSALKEVVKTRSDGAITVPSTQLQLFLAKTKDGVWLPDDVALDAIQQSGNVPPSYTKMRGSWKLSKLFKSGLSLEGEVIHVLAVIPKGASPSQRTLGLSMEALEQNLLDTFEWREPKRLCGSAGSDWPYQGIADVASVLMHPLVEHYEAWQCGSRDEQTHPIFLALSGPGTGKSRTLDEMQTLLKEAAKQANNQDLDQKMESACVFRMSFEYDTPVTKQLLDVESADLNISYRMLAKERKDWPTHVVALKNSLGKLPLTIGKVLEFVAKQKKMQDVEDMTVIFCVDGLQHVENDDFCTLSRIMKQYAAS
ncbi:unnamed protein product [Phytophthora lilii]|uniref:Unnamed protein product n=1 Tax=Phytophthora lilii TaxID=2077276 RepID=A0A9W7CKE0_9STRA|nr:unnamed protein product [Phytophthora lilii]